MTPRTLVLLLVCLVLAACGIGGGGATGPSTGGPGDSFILDFSTRAIPPGSGTGPEVEVEARLREIYAQGSIGTSLPCTQVRGGATSGNSRISLKVTASADESCSTEADTFAYEAHIRDLAAGSYRFFLIHILPQRTDTVVDRQVEVQ